MDPLETKITFAALTARLEQDGYEFVESAGSAILYASAKGELLTLILATDGKGIVRVAQSLPGNHLDALPPLRDG
jgi:hypothetical protein